MEEGQTDLTSRIERAAKQIEAIVGEKELQNVGWISCAALLPLG